MLAPTAVHRPVRLMALTSGGIPAIGKTGWYPRYAAIQNAGALEVDDGTFTLTSEVNRE